MVPITLAAIGETIEESAGLFNIGLEGILLISALSGALGAEASGSALIGLTVGMGTGALIGLVFGVVNTYWKGSQLITGVGINLFAFGFVAFMLIILGAPGFHSVPRTVQIQLIPLGVGSLSPLVIVTVILAVGVYWLLRRTQLGLRIRAVGENPAAADVAGIRVNALRLGTAVAAGCLAGLAGAYLSVDWFGAVTKELVAGRGFIALATVVFSGLNPLLALLGGFIFGFFDTLATWIPTYPKVKDIIPWQLVAMAPYIVTLLVVAAIVGVLLKTLGDATLVFHEVDAAVEMRADLGDDRFRVVGTPLPSLLETTVDGESALVFTLCAAGSYADVVHVGDPAELFQPGVPVVLQGAWVAGSVPGLAGLEAPAADGWHLRTDHMVVKHDNDYRVAEGRTADVAACGVTG